MRRACAILGAFGLSACFSASSGGGGPDASFSVDGGGLDAALDSTTAPDGETPDSSSPADASDASTSPVDARADAVADSAAEASPVDASTDAVVDASCGSTVSDPNNCGACGHSCLGGGCANGMCQPVAIVTGRTNPTGIAVDANNVYWTENSFNGQVMQAPVGGGTVTTLAALRDYPYAIAVDATTVYWQDDVANMAVPIGGGTAVTIAAIPSLGGGQGQGGLALDPSSLYWTNDNEYAGMVMRSPYDGGAASTLASGLTYPNTLALYAGNLYFTVNGHVAMVPTSGGGATTLAAFNNGTSTALAVGPTGIYWTDELLGPLLTVGLDGGTPTTLAANTTQPFGVAIDATHVYWTTFSGGTVMRLPLAGGTPVTVASGSGSPMALALDSAFVYWTDQTAGVWKVAK